MAYVKLEDVLKVLNKRNMTKNIAINEIKNIPTADVVEVKRGEWILYKPKHYKCSVCDNKVGGVISNYCNYCGAKMDGGKEE